MKDGSEWRLLISPAWVINTVGILLLGVAVWFELPMWLVEFGLRMVSDWEGEYMLALYIGFPGTILSTIILGIAVIRHDWCFQFTRTAFALSLILLIAAPIVIIINEVG